MENHAIQTNGLTRLFGALAAVEDVAGALPGVEQGQRFTLEEIFLAILGADGHQESTQELSWLP
jgi:hypothetical protein